MKHYIILTGAICNMGGAEMFTSNKVRYLHQQSWKVNVFFFNRSGKILLDNLSEFKDNYLPELRYGYYYYSPGQREKILDVLCSGISLLDEVIVESHLMNLTYWGEMMAKRCKGISILNVMEEKIARPTAGIADFIKFKMKRWEILNGSSKALKNRYLQQWYDEGYDMYTHTLMNPLCSNVVSDIDTSIDIPATNSGINIMSIGRLDKPYIKPMFEEVHKYISDNPGNDYNLLVVGGSPNGEVESIIKKLFENLTNMKLYLYGYMYPVPMKLLRIVDVCIASANSVLVTAEQGIPTISISIDDAMPLGIYGITTNNKFVRENEPIIPVSTWLRQVLSEGMHLCKSGVVRDPEAEFDDAFKTQLEFISRTQRKKEYYDVMKIHSTFDTLLARIKCFYFLKTNKWEHIIIK